MKKQRAKTTPERLLPVITRGVERKLQFLDVTIRSTYITIQRNSGICCNSAADMLVICFTRLFRTDDHFNEHGDVVLSDDDFFYFDYEIEINPSEGSLYSQLLVAAFHGKDIPDNEFSPSMLVSNWVRLVIVDGRFLGKIQSLIDTSVIAKDQ